MKKQLKGYKKKLEKDKWKLIVNLGWNPSLERYERRSRIFYGNDRQSDAALRDFIYELENPEIIASEMLLSDWLSYWLENFSKQNHEKNTYKRNEILIRVNIVPYIGHIPIGELTTDHVQTLYEILIKEGKIKKTKNKDGEAEVTKSPLSVRTVRYVHTVLNQSLNEALKRDKIGENPCKNASPPRKKESAPGKWVVLTAEQLKGFLDDDQCKSHRDYALIHTASYSGARESELFGLTKDRILWKESAIKVDQSLHKNETGDGKSRFEHRSRTKNKSSSRIIKLSTKSMTVLAEHIKKQEEAGISTNLVFVEPDGRPISRNNLGARFSRLAKKLGYPGMTFHHLRHTHATILLSSGAYIVDVSKRLGHASVNITLSIYAHCLPQGDDRLVQAFDSLLK